MSSALQTTYDSRWFSAALRQIAEARWKKERLTTISGPPGTGKTTLCRRVADRDSTRTFVVLLLTPPSTANGFLRAIATEIGVLSKTDAGDAPITNDDLRQAISEFLSSLTSLGADCLMVVDDAERLDAEAVAEVHTLLASPAAQRASLQFVLVGQFEGVDAGAAPAPAPPARVVREPRPVPLEVFPGVRATSVGSTLALPPLEEPLPVGVPRPPNRRIVSRLTAAAVVACVLVWYGVAYRRMIAPPAPNANASQRRAAEAKLTAIVTEIGKGADAQESAATTPALVPQRREWVDEIARRGVVLAMRPDVEGLIALRAEVAALHATNTAEQQRLDSALRRLDDSLKGARKRQLDIDHSRLGGAASAHR